MATYVVIDDTEVAPEAPVTTSLMTRLRDNALAYAGAPTGTRALWQQTSAPLGWTKDTSHNDKVLRLTSGTAGSGGSVAFSTLFARTQTDSFTISQANLPSVNFTLAGTASVSSVVGGIPWGMTTAGTIDAFGGVSNGVYYSGGLNIGTINSTGSISGTAASGGSGTAMAAGIDMRVAYLDLILAEKAA